MVTGRILAGEIIRQGDSTSHGGTVLEGSLVDICHGKPIAYVGHKTHCPKCKGDFPIVEGVLTTTFYGQGVALAGMKTACGATLIASQFLDTVEWGGGAMIIPNGGDNTKVPRPYNSANVRADDSASETSSATTESALSEHYDDCYILLGMSDGNPLINTAYAIEREDGSVEYGITDAGGHTHLLKRTLEAEHVRIYLDETL